MPVKSALIQRSTGYIHSTSTLNSYIMLTSIILEYIKIKAKKLIELIKIEVFGRFGRKGYSIFFNFQTGQFPLGTLINKRI